MSNITALINSIWKTEKGKWNNSTESYTNRTVNTFQRMLEMQLKQTDRGQIIQFVGGPTGFESYYTKDILATEAKNSICICGGTINSWPACYVDAKTVHHFIENNQPTS